MIQRLGEKGRREKMGMRRHESKPSKVESIAKRRKQNDDRGAEYRFTMFSDRRK